MINSQEDSKLYYSISKQDSPTLYFSFLPQFAHKFKEGGKGLIFVGQNFILGLIGNKENDEMVGKLEAACKEMSSKPVKTTKKADVKFDFKIKGQKPIQTKDICQFNITGADFKEDKIVEILKEYKVAELD